MPNRPLRLFADPDGREKPGRRLDEGCLRATRFPLCAFGRETVFIMEPELIQEVLIDEAEGLRD